MMIEPGRAPTRERHARTPATSLAGVKALDIRAIIGTLP
jgi:hypothetical protein